MDLNTRLEIGKLELGAESENELLLIDEASCLRASAERFAQRIYRKKYGANLKTYCRELIVLQSNQHGIVSCIGINTPESGALFLEQYLDMPLEKAISGCIGENIERKDLAEVGTVAVYTNGLCRIMMAGLAGLLIERGKRFIAFTAIKSLRNTLEHLGIPFQYIIDARPERFGGGVEEWGSYYESSPQVVFIDLKECWRQVNEVLNNVRRKHSEDMENLMNDMFMRGKFLGKGAKLCVGIYQ